MVVGRLWGLGTQESRGWTSKKQVYQQGAPRASGGRGPSEAGAVSWRAPGEETVGDSGEASRAGQASPAPRAPPRLTCVARGRASSSPRRKAGGAPSTLERWSRPRAVMERTCRETERQSVGGGGAPPKLDLTSREPPWMEDRQEDRQGV